ncbi:unnamed protein product, partial [Prorocentrum cordatum]
SHVRVPAAPVRGGVRRCAMTRHALAGLALVARFHSAAADIDNVFPVVWSTNPLARHVACAVPAGVPTVCTLAPYEESNLTLNWGAVDITALPAVGALYETSQNYKSYGSDPKYVYGAAIEERELPYLVGDTLSRVVYVPPADIFPPEGRWATVTYQTEEPASGVMSETGFLALGGPSGYIAGSTFIAGADDWTISGNIHADPSVTTSYASASYSGAIAPTWQSLGWGLLNRYIYGTDEVHYVDFDTGSDRSKWYFEAPAAKFYMPDMASAYGGTIRFTIASTYGDFAYLNADLDFIVVEVTLAEGNFWKRDPMNRAKDFTDATACEISAVLAGLTRLRILGDHTRAGLSGSGQTSDMGGFLHDKGLTVLGPDKRPREAQDDSIR